jgi:hypothetical protein
MATRIVGGIFDTQQAAHVARDELLRAGFESHELDEFMVSPPGRHDTLPMGGDEVADAEAKGGEGGALTGAAIGSAVGIVAGLAATPILGPAAIPGGLAAGAYAGSLAGAVRKMGDDPLPQTLSRPAGVMIAANLDSHDDESLAVGLMKRAGACLIERAEGAWHDGHWVDFDPVRPPQVIERTPA